MDTSDKLFSDPAKKPKVAVLLYGLIRQMELCAPSLLLNVAEPLDASILYFGPDGTDRPTTAFRGTHDRFGGFIDSPKKSVSALEPIDKSILQQAYGHRLKSHKFHSKPQSDFSEEAKATVKPSQWMFKLDPARLFSMFYNIQGVALLLEEYERTSGETFDAVLLTRPDLCFYSTPVWELRPKELHIAKGEGFDAFGNKHGGNAPVVFYKNAHRGWHTPAGRSFNDQILLFNREDLRLFTTFYNDLKQYFLEGFPATPESIFYLHLISLGRLKLFEHDEWVYEIRRADMPIIQSVIDTPAISVVDRTHPAAIERRKARPVLAALKDAKHILRGWIHRVVR